MKNIIKKYLEIRTLNVMLNPYEFYLIYKEVVILREAAECNLLNIDSSHACINCKAFIPDFGAYLSNLYFCLEKLVDVLASISLLDGERKFFKGILAKFEKYSYKLKLMGGFFAYLFINEKITHMQSLGLFVDPCLINFKNKTDDTFTYMLYS